MRYGGWLNPGVIHRIYTYLSEKDTKNRTILFGRFTMV